MREDGFPHIISIVFVAWLNTLWMPIDGKPKSMRALARLHHIKCSPYVSLLLDEYHEDWKKLWWLRIDAHAAIYDNLSIHTECAKIKCALFKKYPQCHKEASMAEISALVCFIPTQIRAWSICSLAMICVITPNTPYGWGIQGNLMLISFDLRGDWSEN